MEFYAWASVNVEATEAAAAHTVRVTAFALLISRVYKKLLVGRICVSIPLLAAH